ncbi:LysR family transcriptional regulator [Mesorhizobium sp.]|uniref:LysR family transcriptional regulator n=1 Tax=Mesorhizobium sp. TaxID=1871066 RepID=UPI0013E3C902|nr:LysR family transcriptional regulator [Mesorhizobium sp.]
MNLAAVDLNLLVAFDALLSEGSVSGAAARIGLSQPAMSKRLAHLRRLFADDLFAVMPMACGRPKRRSTSPIRSGPRYARSRMRWED